MRDYQQPGRSPVYAENAVIATSHPLASEVGLSVLKSGGNAVDAAIAAVATLCVVEPGMTGIGGDCFALYHKAGSDRPIAMNGSGKAPKAASVEALRERGVETIEVTSPHAVTVPGAIAAWTRLNADHGSKGMDELLAPAIRYAEEGYPVYPKVGYDWEGLAPKLAGDAVSREMMLVDGKAPKVGSRHRQPALAATLKRIAREGRDAFYLGAVAEDMVERLNGLGGLHTLDDFAAADAEYVEPIHTRYRGHDVWECPPNGQGLCALIILNILADYDYGNLSEVDRIHLMAEAAKLAYRQRDHYITDPKYADVPVDWMLSADHAASLRAMIDPGKAGRFHNSDFPEHKDTTYLAVTDAGGNAISFINSLFAGFGSAIMAPRSGVMLHNRGSSFRVDAGHANRIEGRKRPMHTIIPGMLTRDGAAVGPFGVMGGQYQSVGHATFLTNLLDRGLDPQASLDAPRSFAYDGVVEMETGFAAGTRDAMAARGHDVVTAAKPLGGGQCVLRDSGTGYLVGGSDPRKDGCAIGF
jgi:gamma-glutamyltranspeptidase / glutathione hydrolase